jgi:ferredoxin
MKIKIFYFSGTGNTKFVALKLKEFFENKNNEVFCYKIEKNPKVEIEKEDTVIFMFPAAAYITYRFVIKFLKSLKLDNNPLYVVYTMGNEAFAVEYAMYVLSKKINGNLRGVFPVLMPSNYYFGKVKEEKENVFFKKFEKKHLPEIGEVILKGENVLKTKFSFKEKFFTRYFFVILWFFLDKMERFFYVDKKLCVKCGLCAKLCPVSNIDIKNYPEFNGRCEQCMRCISFCPTNAIKIKVLPNFKPYKHFKSEYILKDC